MKVDGELDGAEEGREVEEGGCERCEFGFDFGVHLRACGDIWECVGLGDVSEMSLRREGSGLREKIFGH